MNIEVIKIDRNRDEYIEIGCHKVNSRVDEIVNFVKSRQGTIEVTKEDTQYTIPIVDILYIESVDDRLFLYLENECYESRRKLYELEEMLSQRHFLRISKSVLVNLLKIQSIKPALNGRFLCRLINGEDVIVSRKYVPNIKERLAR